MMEDVERLDSRYSALDVAKMITEGGCTSGNIEVVKQAYILMAALEKMARLTRREP